ncbi:nuclear transport factor 2 family protein [Mongoliibacter ruber]|uniref:Uncharacterized protein DUF4440 n=1 Tax=Mongoliibacter ruber TaxID=1750599 RepID=A0A2T0WEM7_9BACT|nr:nuclear transport factor 2 family protein [Mongoliibacter ruber]PRY85116.1 uncharacterized protein DUF4440 [Mongoliibacter ruber]
MKILINFILVLLTMGHAFPQGIQQTAEVELAVKKLFEVMESGEEEFLSSLLSENLSYGHSSGLIQDKEAFMNEVISRKPLHLKNILGEEETITIASNTAIVRHVFVADGVMPNGEIVPVRIGNCMVWIKNEGKWQLLVRQAFKLN